MKSFSFRKSYLPFYVLTAGLIMMSVPTISRIGENSGICLADTFLAGSVSGDWYASTGNFLIYDSIYIAMGNTLTIHPGVVIKFNSNNEGLNVMGTLIALGALGDSVTFTSTLTTPYAGAWDRIYFNGPASNNSRMEYCVVKYATKGIRILDSSPTIKHSAFRNCEEQGIYASSTYGHFDSCEVANSGFTGMIFFNGAPTVRYNHSHHNGNTGLTLDGVSNGEATHNILDYNSEEGLYMDNACVGIDIGYNYIGYNSTYGIRVNDCYTTGLAIEIFHNVIYRNVLDGAYIDNSNIRFINNTVANNERDGIFLYASGLIFYNNIVDNNDNRGIYIQNPVSATIGYNDVWQNATADYLGCSPGLGDISLDPLYVSPTFNDYQITENSPCKDAGNPSPMYNDPDETRNDMGALFFNQSSIINPGEKNLPRNSILIQNYPNPFNSETIIELSGSIQSGMFIDIYNMNGQIVRSISVDSFNLYYRWDGKDESGKTLPAGIYFGRAGDSNSLKMILLK